MWYFSEDALSAALDDLAKGRSLLETSNLHHIPRSTLYARARSYGIAPTIPRQEYTEEKLSEAIETVKGVFMFYVFGNANLEF